MYIYSDRASADIAQLLRRFENLVALAPVSKSFNYPLSFSCKSRSKEKGHGTISNITAWFFVLLSFLFFFLFSLSNSIYPI